MPISRKLCAQQEYMASNSSQIYEVIKVRMMGSKQTVCGEASVSTVKKDEHAQHRQPIMPSWRACTHLKNALCMWMAVVWLGLFVRPLAVGLGSTPGA